MFFSCACASKSVSLFHFASVQHIALFRRRIVMLPFCFLTALRTSAASAGHRFGKVILVRSFHSTCSACLQVEQRAHGVVVSHPLRMRKALGSIPSVSICVHMRAATKVRADNFKSIECKRASSTTGLLV